LTCVGSQVRHGCRPEPISYQSRYHAILHQHRLRSTDRIPEPRVALTHADTQVLAGDPGLNHFKAWAVADVPFRNRREFHEHVTAASREVVQRLLDLVIGVYADSLGTLFADEFVRHRLARIALLHSDHQAVEIIDPMHV